MDRYLVDWHQDYYIRSTNTERLIYNDIHYTWLCALLCYDYYKWSETLWWSVMNGICTLCAYICAAVLCVWSHRFVYVCMCVRMYMWTKKRAVWGLTTGKSPVSTIYCSLVEFNGQKGTYYARRFILGKKFGTILLMGCKKGPGKLYYGKPRLAYMQFSYMYAMPNAERQQLCRL